MDDKHGPLPADGAGGFLQDTGRLFAVKDIEKKTGILRTCVNAKTVVEDVALLAEEITYPAFLRALTCSSYHGRIDIECAKSTRD